MTLIPNVFSKFRTPKNMVTSMFKKSRIKGILWKTTWYTRTNIVEICMAALLPYLLIAVKGIDFQKVSVSDMQNLKTVS